MSVKDQRIFDLSLCSLLLNVSLVISSLKSIYREETARNINQQDEAKRAAMLSPVKNNSLACAPVKDEECHSALAKNIFEKVCGKSSVKISEKSPEMQLNLF